MTARRYRRLIKLVKHSAGNENRSTNFIAGGAAMIHASPAQHPSDEQTPATRADPWTAGNKNGGRQPASPPAISGA